MAANEPREERAYTNRQTASDELCVVGNRTHTRSIDSSTLAEEREIVDAVVDVVDVVDVVVVVRRRSKWLKTSSIGFGAIESIYRGCGRKRVHIYQQTNIRISLLFLF